MLQKDYPEKDWKYKPLTKKLLREAFNFLGVLEDFTNKKTGWELEDLSSAAKRFGRALSINLIARGETVCVDYFVKKNGPHEVWRGILKISSVLYAFNKEELEKICDIISEFRDKFSYKHNGKDKTIHFMLIGENRSISSYLSKVPEKPWDKEPGDNLVPPIMFKRSAIEAIKSGSTNIEIENGYNLISEVKCSYILIPWSLYGYQYFSHLGSKGESLLLEGKSSHNFQNNDIVFEIPSIYNERPVKLTKLILTILIDYYVSFNNFDDIAICRMCNKLTFKSHTGEDICPSNTCRWKLWRENNPRDYETTKCRNKQNKWVKDNTGKNHLGKSPEFCVDCELETFPPGGQCPRIVGKYDNFIAAYKKEKLAEKEGRKSFSGKGNTFVEGTNDYSPKNN